MTALSELPIKKSGIAAFAAEGSGIDGDWIKHSGKTGEWSIDGDAVDARDVRICPFLEGATAGVVKWGKNEKGNPAIVDRRVSRIDDEAPAGPGQIEEGYNPYTSFFGVRIHKDGKTSPITFTSSSWGDRFAVGRLMSQFVSNRGRMLPICALESKARNDANGNYNPVFKIVTWVPGTRFTLPADEPAKMIEDKSTGFEPGGPFSPEACAKAALEDKKSTAEIIEDDLPW